MQLNLLNILIPFNRTSNIQHRLITSSQLYFLFLHFPLLIAIKSVIYGTTYYLILATIVLFITIKSTIYYHKYHYLLPIFLLFIATKSTTCGNILHCFTLKKWFAIVNIHLFSITQYS